jgi:hypothetical protein
MRETSTSIVFRTLGSGKCAASYLEVLTNDTNYFSAELALAQAQLNEVLALVQLYRALGGGWQEKGNVPEGWVNEGQSILVFP